VAGDGLFGASPQFCGLVGPDHVVGVVVAVQAGQRLAVLADGEVAAAVSWA
jgi:hypothetical protein